MGGKKKGRGGNNQKSKSTSNKRRPKASGLQSVDDGEDQPNRPTTRRNSSFNNNTTSKRNNSKRKLGRHSKSWQADDTELRSNLASNGMEIVEMSSDGNCLFRSLSDQLFGDFGNMHDHVRWAIVDYMKKNADNFRHFLVYEDEDDEDQTEEDARDFEHYIDMMGQDGEWGGNLELVAAASLYGRKIIVYQSSMGPAFTIDNDGSKSAGSDLLVSYHDNDHYNSVRRTTSPPRSSKDAHDITMKASSSSPPPSYSNYGNGTSSNNNPDDGSDTEKTEDEDYHQEEEEETDDNEDTTGDFSTVDVSINCGVESQSPTTSAATTSTSFSSSKSSTRVTRSNAVVKKNDACPCGSGLRYKKCCLARQKHAIRLKNRSNKDDDDENDDDGGNNDGDTDVETEQVERSLQVIQI